jgi:DNA polymerase-3 subunit epsilon
VTPDNKFAAVDVETANSDCSSICQIGIVFFNRGTVTDEWVTYVNPETGFDPFNIGLHGIGPATVAGACAFPALYGRLSDFLAAKVVIHHTHFDRSAFNRACAKYGLSPFNCRWLDSARIARRAWPRFARQGYALKNICSFLGYDFQHHDALADAKAAGMVAAAAFKETGLDIGAWLRRVEQPINCATMSSRQPRKGIINKGIISADGLPEPPGAKK